MKDRINYRRVNKDCDKMSVVPRGLARLINPPFSFGARTRKVNFNDSRRLTEETGMHDLDNSGRTGVNRNSNSESDL